MTQRVLHIIPTLDRGGAEKQLALLAAGLPRDEFDVHICALTRGGPLSAELEQHGVPITVIGKRWKADPLAFWKLYRHIARLRPDLVHTWLFAANAYGRAAARIGGVRHIVASERCADPWKSAYQLTIDRFLARRTDRIVVNSTGVRDFYLEHGLPQDRMVLIPNGVEHAAPSGVCREELLAELDLPSDARLVGAIGRLWPQKRIKDLIWVAELMDIMRKDVHVLIIGDGPQRRNLERYARLLHAESYVHFLGQRNDVPRILPHLDVLWLASAYEGMPNSIMEAMAAGVPVVATDIPGNCDLVVPGETGFLVPVGSRAEFTRRTEQILNDTALAKGLGEAARRRVLEKYSVEQMVDRHVAMYRELFSSPAPRTT